VQAVYHTQRLTLKQIDITDGEFLMELMNTAGWIKFIGDRNIKTREAAENYIRGILSNSTIDYWVVSNKLTGEPMGVISFIKRDYLDHHDIGFAFLDRFLKSGYAFEATQAVLLDAISSGVHARILASTLKENVNSIRLLEKLGFQYHEEIVKDNEALIVYAKSV
jgi:[ribosomal protein S5]-alanine N-acetyltransferase